jgi:hypothetical protein
MSRFRLAFSALGLSVLAAACDCHDHCDDCNVNSSPPPEAHPVSILVEVFDPVTNLVWENVSVRVAQADQEWCGCTFVSTVPQSFLTDNTGRVLLDEFDLADVQVGFQQDAVGRAQLAPFFDADQALVVIEVFAVGFTAVVVSVPLRWDDPDVFVRVPFH